MLLQSSLFLLSRQLNPARYIAAIHVSDQDPVRRCSSVYSVYKWNCSRKILTTICPSTGRGFSSGDERVTCESSSRLAESLANHKSFLVVLYKLTNLSPVLKIPCACHTSLVNFFPPKRARARVLPLRGGRQMCVRAFELLAESLLARK